MLPLETVDRYVLVCLVAGVSYLGLMLAALLCLLRMYKCPGCGSSSRDGPPGTQVGHSYSQVSVGSSLTRAYLAETYQMVPCSLESRLSIVRSHDNPRLARI